MEKEGCPREPVDSAFGLGRKWMLVPDVRAGPRATQPLSVSAQHLHVIPRSIPITMCGFRIALILY